MKIRIALVAALAVIAVSAFALSTENAEWGKGPAQFLMTKEEAAQWKAVKTDEEAAKFIALFWARRDPSPQTPRNEFRDEFENRVRQADINFKQEKQRGALTDRGKIYILYGLPAKLERSGNQRQSSQPQGITNDPSSAQAQDDFETLIWTYDGAAASKYFGQPRAVIRFIDRFGKSDFRVERGGVDLTASQQRAIAASITQPNLTEAPNFAAAPQQPAAPAAPAAPAVQTELTTDALKSAVAEFKSSNKNASPVYATTGEFVTANGVTYAPVLVYVPKASAPGADATFFGVVEDASGKSVLAFEEPAKLTATKDDFFVDKSLTLPAGKYRGYFGVSGGGKVSLVATDMELTGALDKEATASSPLILSNNVYPMTAAQAPTDPFAFGGLKVVPKADRTFRPTDELWYFVELRNPGVPEATPATDTATVQIAPPTPKVQVKLDVEGTLEDGKKAKMSAPPMEVEAIPLKGVPNHYGIGSSIPLASFKPGDYTFTAKIIDTVKKTSYTFTEKFKVVQ